MIAAQTIVKPTLMTRLLRLTGFALACLLIFAIAAMIYVAKIQAHGLINHPREGRGVPGDELIAQWNMAYENISLTAADGTKLAAWYIPSQNGASVILVHGFKNNRADMLNEAAMLEKNGYGSILIALRAHDASEGEVITFGKYEVQDLEAAYQYLLTRDDVDPERIGIIGNSMGANVTILFAADQPQVKAVVANSSFASLQDEVAVGVEQLLGLPPFPFAPMVQFFAEQETGLRASEIAADERIDEISPRPILIMHGGADTLVPSWNGQRLYDAANEPKELWFEAGTGHTGFDTGHPEEYERRVIALFNEYLLGSP